MDDEEGPASGLEGRGKSIPEEKERWKVGEVLCEARRLRGGLVVVAAEDEDEVGDNGVAGGGDEGNERSDKYGSL